jgi:hypothetical protein
MARGRERNQRAVIVAQAALVWITASADELEEFIDTGWMPVGSDSSEAVFPYDPDALKQMIAQRG